MMTTIDTLAYIGESLYLKKPQTAEDLIRWMDKYGIDISVTTTPPPAIGQNYANSNKIVYEATQKYPDRILGFYRVNPWFKEEEIERAKTAIKDWNFKGFLLNPFHDSYGLIGFNLDKPEDPFNVNPLLCPVLDLATKLDVPVFIHTGDSSFCPPDAIPKIAKTYPMLTLMTELTAAIKCLDTKNVIFGTYPLRGGHEGIDMGLKLASTLIPDRVLFTTNCPFGYPEFELRVIELTGIESEARRKIMSDNAKIFLKI